MAWKILPYIRRIWVFIHWKVLERPWYVQAHVVQWYVQLPTFSPEEDRRNLETNKIHDPSMIPNTARIK